jgi:RNA polymerase sigma factor (sigma-70 family)
VGDKIMTATENSVAAEPDPAKSSAAVAHPSSQQQGGERTGQHCGAPGRTRAHPARDDPVVIDLVTRAANGDKRAWDLLIERYSPLILSICRRHRLGQADAEDVGQSVWLYLLERLDKVRDPAALPGWLATTTRRECLRALGRARGPHPGGRGPDLENIPDEHARTAEQELLVAERNAALREAVAALHPDAQRLITLLAADPPVPYAQISARLGIPVGSIGPNRGRCLNKLRRHPAIAALINADRNAADTTLAQAAA